MSGTSVVLLCRRLRFSRRCRRRLCRGCYYCIAQTRLEKVDFWTCFASINKNNACDSVDFIFVPLKLPISFFILLSRGICNVFYVFYWNRFLFSRSRFAQDWMESLTDLLVDIHVCFVNAYDFQGPEHLRKAICRRLVWNWRFLHQIRFSRFATDIIHFQSFLVIYDKSEFGSFPSMTM